MGRGGSYRVSKGKGPGVRTIRPLFRAFCILPDLDYIPPMTEEREDRRGGGTAMPQPHGGAIGNPPYEATEEKRRQVRELAGLQISQQEIADVMGVSADTIQRHHREDFDQGRAAFALKMRKHAFNLALGELKDPDDPSKGYKDHFTPDRDMTKFVMRSQFGWQDSVKMVHEGGDPAKPLNVELTHIRRVVVDPKNPT